MKDRFSGIDAIGRRRHDMVEPIKKMSLWNVFFPKREPVNEKPIVTLRICETDLDFSRAESFVDDLEEESGGSVMNLVELIAILYKDFF